MEIQDCQDTCSDSCCCCVLKHRRLHSLCGLLSAVQVNDVVFSSDERHFATCSEDGSVRVWSATSNELVVQFQVLNQVREYPWEIV